MTRWTNEDLWGKNTANVIGKAKVCKTCVNCFTARANATQWPDLKVYFCKLTHLETGAKQWCKYYSKP